ncbi:MAG: HAD family hydrolase [Phycisphaerae bacterium]|nr:HAD family hydrolase [Phycisphaerae bacterium]
MTTYKAILFDLDGTLLDTIDDLTDSMNAALAAFELPTHSTAACKQFIGDGVRNFVQRALPPSRRDDATITAVMARYRQAYSTNWDNKTRPYEGIEPLLDALTARGLKMVVYSNKPDEFTQLAVRKLLPRWPFDAIAGAREGWPHKPDPAAARNLAAQLAIPPEQFVYLGDTNTDMQTATRAGMFPAGALWGFRTAQELLDNGANVLLAHPMELLAVLNQ